MTMSVMDNQKFQEVVRSAAQQLVSIDPSRNGAYVRTPLLYASGSYVVIRVDAGGGEFFVSDFGAGHEEAQQLGASATFKRVAKTVAEANGVGFDTHSFFALTVSEAQLPGAIASIANASQEAVNITALKASERSLRDDNDELFDRLRGIFSPKAIAKDANIVGASNTQWHVSTLVTIQNKMVAFEAVSKAPQSIVFASTKFSDIARLPKAPGRVAVVSNKKALGTYLGVLSHNADVIERKVEDRIFHRLLGAAA